MVDASRHEEHASARATPTVEEGAEGSLDSTTVYLARGRYGLSRLSDSRLFEEARARSGVDRIRGCCQSARAPVGRGLQMRRHADGQVNVDLMRCDSKRCLFCARQRARMNRARLQLAIDEAARRGLRVLLATFTFSNAELDPCEQLSALLGAWKNHSTFAGTKELKALGVEASILRIEDTHRPIPGTLAIKCHVHAHALFFVRSEAPLEQLSGALRRRWVQRVEHVGQYAQISSQDVQEVELDDGGAGAAVSRYVAGDTVSKRAGGAEGAALELTHDHVKSWAGRRAVGGMSREQLARWILTRPLADQRSHWAYWRVVEAMGLGKNGGRGVAFVRISGAVFEWFEAKGEEGETGSECLRRLALALLTGEDEAEEADNPVVDEAIVPPDLVTELRKHAPLLLLSAALSADVPERDAIWEQLTYACSTIAGLSGAERAAYVTAYAGLLGAYVRARTRDGPPRDAPGAELD